MHRLLLGVAALRLAALAALFSARQAPGNARTLNADPMEIEVESKNPWTSLSLNNQPRNFQFAIVTDRTKKHHPRVFAEAVKKLNLLQPEFVISIGDLIEGYSEDSGQWALEWTEFQGKLQQLQMPFFYVPGNHDLANPRMADNWKRKFGRTFYEFRYHDVLFVALNSEDPPDSKPYRIGPEQIQWLSDVLARNQNVR